MRLRHQLLGLTVDRFEMTPKPFTTLAALVLSATALFVAWAAPTRLAARDALHRLVETRTGWTITGFDAGPEGVTLRDLRADFADGHVSIGSVRLAATNAPPIVRIVDKAPVPPQKSSDQKPPESKPAPKPGTASAENVVISYKATTYRIKRIDLDNTTLSNADLAALLDPKSTESLESRIAKVSATAITIPEILGDTDANGMEQHWSQRDIVLSKVVAGKAASAQTGAMTFAFKDAKGATNGTAGSLDIANFDMGQFVHVYSTTRTNENEPLLTLFDSAIAKDLTATNVASGQTVTFGLIKEENVKARALRTSLTDVGAMSDPDVADPRRAAIVDDVLHSFDVGLIQFDAISMPIKDPDGEGRITLAQVFLKGFAGGKLGASGLDGASFEGPTGRVKIGRVDLGEFTFPAGAGGAAPPLAGKMDIAGIEVALVTKDKNRTDGAPVPIKFQVAHAGFEAEAAKAGTIPPNMQFSIDHLTFEASNGGDATKLIASMGYDKVDLSSAFRASYDQSGQELRLKSFVLTGVDMGEASLGLDLANVGKDVFSPNAEVAKLAALGMVAKRVRLDLLNRGLFEKAIELKAKMDGVSVDDEKRFGIEFFTIQLPDMANGHATAKQLGAAIAKFIEAPKSLHIEVRSKTGLGAADAALVATPDALLDTLEVKASAND